jgi:hypothetical protein
MLALRIITWAAIVLNWVLIIWLNRLLARARREHVELFHESAMWAQLAAHTMAELQRRAPGTKIELPEEVFRWIEAKHLEYMVYGPPDE